MTKTLLSFGHGFSARALTKLLLPQGWRIIGTTRSSEKAEELAASGVEPLIFPGADIRDAIAEATHLLISAGPDADGDPVLRAVGDQIAAGAPSFEWAGYLSTTGVYGDHQGGWVDETAALTPATKRGQWRVEAEAAWAAIPGLPLHIFRLAGIYGPGRGPFAKVRSGTARRIIKEGQVFSRIHVDDSPFRHGTRNRCGARGWDDVQAGHAQRPCEVGAACRRHRRPVRVHHERQRLRAQGETLEEKRYIALERIRATHGALGLRHENRIYQRNLNASGVVGGGPEWVSHGGPRIVSNVVTEAAEFGFEDSLERG